VTVCQCAVFVGHVANEYRLGMVARP
jgi:hypothetical protein